MNIGPQRWITYESYRWQWLARMRFAWLVSKHNRSMWRLAVNEMNRKTREKRINLLEWTITSLRHCAGICDRSQLMSVAKELREIADGWNRLREQRGKRIDRHAEEIRERDAELLRIRTAHTNAAVEIEKIRIDLGIINDPEISTVDAVAELLRRVADRDSSRDSSPPVSSPTTPSHNLSNPVENGGIGPDGALTCGGVFENFERPAAALDSSSDIARNNLGAGTDPDSKGVDSGFASSPSTQGEQPQ